MDSGDIPHGFHGGKKFFSQNRRLLPGDHVRNNLRFCERVMQTEMQREMSGT